MDRFNFPVLVEHGPLTQRFGARFELTTPGEVGSAWYITREEALDAYLAACDRCARMGPSAQAFQFAADCDEGVAR